MSMATDVLCVFFFDRAFYNTVRERVRKHFEDTKQVKMQFRKLYIEVNVVNIKIVKEEICAASRQPIALKLLLSAAL